MKIIRYIGIALAAVLILAVIGAFVAVNLTVNAPLPEHDGTLSLPGLDDEVQILRDAYGVPHIYATTAHDLFFAQGYVQAQDRWWQMVFSRAVAQGRISELLGRDAGQTGTDMFIRTVGWYDAAARDYALLPDEYRAHLDAFAAGVNAYVSERPPRELALEYSVLGLTGIEFAVEPWTGVDSVGWGKVMAWDLAGNWSAEERNAILASALDDTLLAAYHVPYPYDDHPTVLPLDAIIPYTETTSTAATPSTDSHTRAGDGLSRLVGNVPADFSMAFGRGLGVGSNNWVVSGDLTESGMPLIANDMHLGAQVPSIWYEVALHCAPVSAACDFNVRGFALPAVPGVITGHNERIAWAFTNSGPDVQDSYFIEATDESYTYNGEQRPFDIREETIRYGDGAEPLTFRVRRTHFGPVVTDNNLRPDGTPSGFENDDAVVLRWAAVEVPGSVSRSIFDLNRATDFETFREALRTWDAPSQNIVYADVEGNIGYQLPGLVPLRRAGHTGALPVDGTSDDTDWVGTVPFDLLPYAYNPESGYIGSANQTLVPPAYYDWLADQLDDDINPVFQSNYDLGQRGARIVQLLEELAPHTPGTFAQMHADAYSIGAANIAPALASLDFADQPDLQAAADWLATWDAHFTVNSGQAVLYAYTWDELAPLIFADQLPLGIRPPASGTGEVIVWNLLETPDHPWWDDTRTPDAIETRDDILKTAFAAGYARAAADLGDDFSSWRWGDIHRADMVNTPLGVSGISQIENFVNPEPLPVPGSFATVNNMRWEVSNSGFGITDSSVPSMRSIIDLGNFDNSMAIIPTGQSGHPANPNYLDQYPLWTRTEYHPLYWTREAVEAAAVSRLVLLPAD